jgi:hypothetical protein
VKRAEVGGRGALARRTAAILALGLVLSTPARATRDESLAAEGGTGLGALIATLVYAPLKLAYSSGGMVLAGLTWIWTWGDEDVAATVARAATGGDYVITPSHLRRESDLDFEGS